MSDRPLSRQTESRSGDRKEHSGSASASRAHAQSGALADVGLVDIAADDETTGGLPKSLSMPPVARGGLGGVTLSGDAFKPDEHI